jgi:hypothetical protein
MGEVDRAYDGKMNREVAIKVLTYRSNESGTLEIYLHSFPESGSSGRVETEASSLVVVVNWTADLKK